MSTFCRHKTNAVKSSQVLTLIFVNGDICALYGALKIVENKVRKCFYNRGEVFPKDETCV